MYNLVTLFHFFKEQPSNNKFKVLVREQGAHFTEEVAINMKNKSVVYNVPAHRQISQADVLSDYVSVSDSPNLTHSKTLDSCSKEIIAEKFLKRGET